MSWNKIGQTNLSDLGRKKSLFFSFILFLLCFVFYGNSLSNGYNLDDHFVYTENPKALKGLNDLSAIFKQNSFEGSTYNFGYRPITVLSFAVENEIFGVDPFVSHFINVLLYGLVCLLFSLMLRLVFPNQSLLWFGLCCLFFLAMPVHSEMVNNVKSRDELLMLSFGLLSSISLLKISSSKQKWIWLMVGLVSLLLSILSKKSGIVFIGISYVALYFKGGIKLKSGILIGLLPFAS